MAQGQDTRITCYVEPVGEDGPLGAVLFDLYEGDSKDSIYSGKNSRDFMAAFLIGFQIGRNCDVRMVNVPPEGR